MGGGSGVEKLMTREELEHEIREWLHWTAGLRRGGSVLLALDVGGTVDEKGFEIFKQVASGFDIVNKYDVYYCAFSYEVWAHAPIEEFTIPKFEVGSSNYTKVFKVARESEHDAVIIFSDGYGEKPRREVLPTLWVLMVHLAKPKWGQIINWRN